MQSIVNLADPLAVKPSKTTLRIPDYTDMIIANFQSFAATCPVKNNFLSPEEPH